MGLQHALEYIKEQKVGEFVIRPSSKSQEWLTITWKFWDNSIIHLNVHEEKKIRLYSS